MRAAEVSTIVDEQLDSQLPYEQADTGALGGAPDQAHHICSRDQQPPRRLTSRRATGGPAKLATRDGAHAGCVAQPAPCPRG